MQDMTSFVNIVWRITAELYARQTRKILFLREVTFHGWPHVSFVAKNAHRFAIELRANVAISEIAGLVHDLNYLVNSDGGAAAGSDLRAKILSDAGLDNDAISIINDVVLSAETRTRGRDISCEAMALSDADTLFKALPITPVILSPLYMRETGKSVRELADKIVNEQVPLRDSEIYFYSESAKKHYERWADANLNLWSCISESLDDPFVVELIGEMQQFTDLPADPVEQRPSMRAPLDRATKA